MTRLRLIVLTVMVATIGLAFPSMLHAQSKSTTASLSGSVTDSSGARIAKATVKLTNPEKQISRTGTTSATGEFSFAFLPEGTYTLEVTAQGFKTTRQNGIVLSAGDTVAENLSLTIGATEQIAGRCFKPRTRTSARSSKPSKLKNFLSISEMCSASQRWIRQ